MEQVAASQAGARSARLLRTPVDDGSIVHCDQDGAIVADIELLVELAEVADAKGRQHHAGEFTVLVVEAARDRQDPLPGGAAADRVAHLGVAADRLPMKLEVGAIRVVGIGCRRRVGMEAPASLGVVDEHAGQLRGALFVGLQQLVDRRGAVFAPLQQGHQAAEDDIGLLEGLLGMLGDGIGQVGVRLVRFPQVELLGIQDLQQVDQDGTEPGHQDQGAREPQGTPPSRKSRNSFRPGPAHPHVPHCPASAHLRQRDWPKQSGRAADCQVSRRRCTTSAPAGQAS
ncbi:hypothetical protein D3C84_653730 [compost metagenome]